MRGASAASVFLASALAWAAPPAPVEGSAQSSQTAPPPLQPVRIQHLPMPEDFTGMSHPIWMRDGKHILANFTSGDEPDSQLAVMNRRGREIRCLTCGLDQVEGLDRPFNTGQPLDIDKSFPLPDGRRVVVMIVTQPDEAGTGERAPGPPRGAPDFNYAVLECAPSVLDCRERQLIALELPGGGLSRAVQNREGRMSPDGKWFAFTQVSLEGTAMALGRLVRGESTYTLSDIRVLNPPRPPDGNVDPATWNAAAALYELKTFTPDGKSVLYSSFRTAENFDDFRMDLRTGAVERLTSETEWDEDVSQSPDGRHLALFASRGFDRMTPFSQFERPTYVDFPVFASTGRYMLKQQQGRGAGSCLLAPWLLSSDGQRDSYFGQPLDVGTDTFYPSPTSSWRPQGNAVLFWQYRIGEPVPGALDKRLVIAWLDRARRRRVSAPPPTVEPTWAPSYDDWQGYQHQQRTAVIPGKGGGTATVMIGGGVNFQEQSVTYEGYSDDGETFIDGTERADSPFTVALSRWQADLRARGRHTGRLAADLTLSAGQGGGFLESVWDGRRYEGLPSATRCQANSLPQLAPRVLRTRPSGSRIRIDVRVLAHVPHDATPRPVHGAGVQLGSARAQSDRTGRARLVVSRGGVRPGAVLQASADGFLSGAVALEGVGRACLARRSPIGPRNIGRIRLGYNRRRLQRLAVQAVKRRRHSYRYCVKGGGAVRAVLARSGRVLLVVSTAPSHGNRGVRPGVPASHLRAYARRVPLGAGLVRAYPRSTRVIGVRRGRVRFVAVAAKRLLQRPHALRRHLRRAGL